MPALRFLTFLTFLTFCVYSWLFTLQRWLKPCTIWQRAADMCCYCVMAVSRAGPPLKMQQMLERVTPLGIDPTVVLLRGLNFGVEHLYLDPSPNNEAGAGYFVCGQPGGAEQALLVQVSCVEWSGVELSSGEVAWW